MKLSMRRTIASCLLSCVIANVTFAARAASGNASQPANNAVPQGAALSAEQMDNLLAPIALYPDPLLAQVFPASTLCRSNRSGSALAASQQQQCRADRQTELGRERQVRRPLSPGSVHDERQAGLDHRAGPGLR